MRKLWIAAMLVLGCACAVPAAASAVQFPDGVASGDVTSTRAILWTRVDVADNIKVEVFNNAALQPPKVFQGKLKTSAARDLTVKIDAAGLKPNTQYWYRFRKDEDASPVGTFKTAPAANVPSNLKLGYTGDSDVTKVGGVPQVNDFKTLQALQAENTDAWIYLGDTIYSDSSFRPGGPATTLADYRATYHEGRTYPNLTNLLASTSTYPTMGRPRGRERLRGGRLSTRLVTRPVARRSSRTCRSARRASCTMRRARATRSTGQYSWGSDVDIFMLDERSCRSAESSRRVLR